MKKKEMQLYAAQLVEAGKGLALAENLEDKELKEKTLFILSETIDNVVKQLELMCEDCDYKKIEEVLKDGQETKHSPN